MQIAGKDLDVGEILAKVEPSVVSVETKITQSNQGPFGGSGTATGAGTGIVLDTDGTILTNAHVIEGASTIEVTVPGSSSPRAATVIASDTANDLALLKVANTSGLVAAPLGSSADLQVGDDVVAIGNALALEGGLTVTEGIVSATGRSLQTDTSQLHDLIQTDAAISSGNSGGPLVNAKGQVVGINTAVATSSGSVSASNIGFAISIDQAQKVISVMRSVTAHAPSSNRRRSGTSRAVMSTASAPHSQPMPAPVTPTSTAATTNTPKAPTIARARKRTSPAPMSRPSSTNTTPFTGCSAATHQNRKPASDTTA